MVRSRRKFRWHNQRGMWVSRHTLGGLWTGKLFANTHVSPSHTVFFYCLCLSPWPSATLKTRRKEELSVSKNPYVQLIPSQAASQGGIIHSATVHSRARDHKVIPRSSHSSSSCVLYSATCRAPGITNQWFVFMVCLLCCAFDTHTTYINQANMKTAG